MPSHVSKCPNSSEPDPTLRIIGKYRDHRIVKLIKTKSNFRVFNFSNKHCSQIFGFLDFSGGIKWEHWSEIG